MNVEKYMKVKCPTGAEAGRTTAVVSLINRAVRRREYSMLTFSGLVPDRLNQKFIRTWVAGAVIRFTPHL